MATCAVVAIVLAVALTTQETHGDVMPEPILSNATLGLCFP